MSFWKSPRKTALRWWMFEIHFYLGVIAGLLWLVIGITGSVLVFEPELRRASAPDWSRVVADRPALPIETVLERFREARPTDRVGSLNYDFNATWAVNIRSTAADGRRMQTYFDQYRGTVLYSYAYDSSVMQFFWDLHGDLLGGPTGRTVNAWFALIFCVAAMTGLLLWWRGRRQWKLGLVYRYKASWKRQMWDLHNVGGFVTLLPLLLLGVTGAWYGFRPAFTSVIVALTGGPTAIPAPKAPASNAPRKSLDEMYTNAARAIPDGTLSNIGLPSKAGDPISFRLHRDSDPDWMGMNWVYLDPATAQVLRTDIFTQQPLGVKIVRLMTPIHFGVFGGTTTRILWIVLGLLPGVLFVTALLMWWNRSLSKKFRKAATAEAEPILTGAPR